MAVLLLSDGTTFNGKAFGYAGTTVGEICFNTGMTGYQEIFTDPSYFGQLLVMNNVHIGNYGVCEKDTESKHVTIKGLVARNLDQYYSRHLAQQSLQDYFLQQKIVAIHQIDTRALVSYIRKNGSMNAILSTDSSDLDQLREQLATAKTMENQNLSPAVSTKTIQEFTTPSATKKIAVLDFGIKQNILNCLLAQNFSLTLFPHNIDFETLKAINADAYFLSNGPGDPAAMTEEVSLVKKILSLNKPVFGICLGHQLIALVNGLTTYKLKYGHRGINHPVRNIEKNRVEITTQNHGFGVNALSIANNKNVVVTHININDQSIEGIRLKDKPVFSVQYHPEATPGPHDSRYLFEDFARLIYSAAK